MPTTTMMPAETTANPPVISAADRLPRRRVRVLDAEIDRVDAGEGRPIVFLHGRFGAALAASVRRVRA